MTIFWKFVMCKNRFLLITHLFKTSWTPSPAATHTKSTMPRRSKGSKHGVRIFIFFGPDFFCRPRFFLSGPTFFIVILDVSEFKTVTVRSGVKRPIRRTTFYLKRRSAARVMTCSVCLNTHLSTCSLDLSEVKCKKQKLCEHKTSHNSGS